MARRKNINVEGGNDNFRINTFCRERENGGNKNCAWELNIWPMAIAAAAVAAAACLLPVDAAVRLGWVFPSPVHWDKNQQQKGNVK
jgi:hypothetical protein